MLIFYFLKEGFKNIWLNGLMAFASVVVMVCCLLITGVAFLVAENIKFTLKNVEGQNSVTIFLCKNADVNKIKSNLVRIKNISSCEFCSKEEAMKDYERMLGERVVGFFQGEANPLPDAFKVRFDDLSQYGSTVEEISLINGIDTISDRSEIAKKLSDLRRLTEIIGFWVIVSLGVVSLLIISNTIRIAMYNRRFEISIMRSIGATNGFIRSPFVIEGIIIGIFSAVVSFFMLEVIYEQFIKTINSVVSLGTISFDVFFYQMFLAFVSIGFLLGLTGGLISIGRYLKKEGAEVVAW
jgi:cell division transport system permease protein